MNAKFQTRQIVTHQLSEKLLRPSFPSRIECSVNCSGNAVEKIGFRIKPGMTDKVKELLTHYSTRS